MFLHFSSFLQAYNSILKVSETIDNTLLRGIGINNIVKS